MEGKLFRQKGGVDFDASKFVSIIIFRLFSGEHELDLHCKPQPRVDSYSNSPTPLELLVQGVVVFRSAAPQPRSR